MMVIIVKDCAIIDVERENPMPKPLFISFEGPEGSGKTSVIQNIYKVLQDSGQDVIVTREPGGVKISEEIRNILLDNQHLGMDPKTEALLFAASRRQHVIEVIKPALDANQTVLCDRYIDSSLAYQGHARGIGIEEVYQLNLFAIESLMPDLTLFIDVRPEVGLARVKNNQREMDRLDNESLTFHEKVYEGYMKLTEIEPDRIKIINGNQPIENVVQDALKHILA
jgi:dTMP kinase